MRDLLVEGDSTCLQAILDPFGRTMTTIVEPAYRGVAGSVPSSVPENPFLLVSTQSVETPVGRSASRHRVPGR